MASSSTNDERESALSLAEQAEAEAEAAEAEAAAARARAAELRAAQTTESTDSDETTDSDAAEADADLEEISDEASPAAAAVDTESRGRRKWIPAWPVLAVAAAVVAICGLLAASGFMLWSSQREADRAATDAEYAAARQGVINLMSLDFNQGEADLQRLIDSTTGDFRADFEASKDDFLTVMNESKVVTEAEVRATAVEQTGKDTATVLVAASSQVTNSAGAEQQPRAWRLSIDVARDNGQVKMSKVEFVP